MKLFLILLCILTFTLGVFVGMRSTHDPGMLVFENCWGIDGKFGVEGNDLSVLVEKKRPFRDVDEDCKLYYSNVEGMEHGARDSIGSISNTDSRTVAGYSTFGLHPAERGET